MSYFNKINQIFKDRPLKLINMLSTVKGIVRKRKIELEEKIKIPEGTRLLITILSDDETEMFWKDASKTSLDKTWNNTEDNIYAELLQK